MSELISVRPLGETDRCEWGHLFDSYREFHKIAKDPGVDELVWGWLMDPEHESRGLVALLDDGIAGIVHYRVSPRSIAGDAIVNLDDLFTLPERRGLGVGRALIESVVSIAREVGAHEVQWVTNGWNSDAQAAYRKLAEETDWVTYTVRIP